MVDVLVIGGGLLGFSTAYHCALGGLRTALVDRADAGWATGAGAGILSPDSGNTFASCRDPHRNA